MGKLKSLIIALAFPLMYLVIQTTVSGVFGLLAGVVAGFKAASGEMSIEQATAEATLEIVQLSTVITAVAALISLVAVILWIVVTRRNVADELRLHRPSALSVVVCLVLGVAANAMISGLMALIPLPESLVNEYNELVGNSLVTGSPLATVLVVGILVPIVEEVVFRGMTMGALRHEFGATCAVVLSSVIFAMAHLIPLQVAFVLPVAFIIGFAYLWSDSMYGAIAVHIGFNIVSAVASAFSSGASSGAGADASALALQAGTMAAAGAAISAVCLCVLWARRPRAALETQNG